MPPESCRFSRRRLLQKGFLIAAGYASGSALFAASPAAGNDTDAAALPQVWTIGNSFMRRTIAFQAKRGLFTRQFSDLSTHAEFVLPGSINQEFSFLCNGQACAGASAVFDLLGASESGIAGGKSLNVRLRHKSLALEVSVEYRVYEGHAAVRKHLVLRNIGDAPLHFSHLNIESLAIALGPENETTLLAQYGALPREILYTGRSEDAGLLLANGRTGIGMAILSEVPGYMKRTEINGWDDTEQIHISALYDTDLMPFERTLAAGQEFTTAAVSLVAFRNGDGFHDPHWRLPAYTSEVLMRRIKALGPPWIYNTWEPFQRSINRDTVLQLIDAAAAMGLDIFTIDDGWQQEYGDNGVNLTSFPGGLQSILEAVEARGMRLGLWMPGAAIGTSTKDYRDHPEWACLDLQGKLKTTETMGGEMAVMCMATPYRALAANRVIDAIERFRLACLRQAGPHHHLQRLWRGARLLGKRPRPQQLARVAQYDL
jgi:alpha-galactosidase